MTLLVVACLAAGAITFQPQQMPGLEAGPVPLFAAQSPLNCRQVDFDGDGRVDLLFDNAVWLQRDGLFPSELRQLLPPGAAGALLDTFGGRLYALREGRLRVFHWKEGAFTLEQEQKLAWPASVPDAPSGLGRFLHDIDGDKVPELISVDERGVSVFAQKGGSYAEAAQLAGVLPELGYLQLPEQPVWPKTRRALSFPARQMACDFVLDGAVLSVVSRRPVQAGQFMFQRESRPLSLKNGVCTAEASIMEDSAAVPEHLRPCRLNGDGMLDLAGYRRTEMAGRAVPASMLETWASLDGGRTFAVRRAAVTDRFLPQTPFIDMDGDGLTDMVTESTTLFEGGTREVVERFMTRPAVDHVVRVYRQRGGTFSDKPDVEFRASIRLEAPPWRIPPAYLRYQTGELTNLCGDYDGDGRRDIAVRDRSDRVALWLSRGGAFGGAPDAVVHVDAAARFAVADVNGDGRSDIIEIREPAPQSKTAAAALVHFSGSGGEAKP